MRIIDRFHLYHRGIFGQADDFSNPNVEQHYPPDLELEPSHLDIDLFIDIDGEEARGSVITTVEARHSGPSKLKLHAVDFLDLSVSDPEDRKLSWSYDGQFLLINWAEPFLAGESRRVKVSYRVRKPVDGLYFSKPNEKYPDQAWFAATDHETERARHWLPCIDLPNARTTLDFRIGAEERFTILANGYLVEEKTHGDGTKTAHWRLEQRCPSYLTCFAVGEFVRANDEYHTNGDQAVELAYFCSREHDAEMLLGSFGRTREMMDWMTKRLAMPFPYPKYYQIALPYSGGAMENISLVRWDDRYVLNEENALELGWDIDMVNVHEMAHSYFGDTVVVRDFAHAWLKESWATYIEQAWCEEKRTEDEAQYMYYDNARRYFHEADNKYKRPIITRRFKTSWQMYDSHLYPGGACRLHTLRRELGDDVFWPAVQAYVARFSEKVVETDDFRHIMEEFSGRSLGKFFDQWFHSPGYPDIKVKFKYDNKAKQGTFEIEQTQVDREKDIPAFELNTALGWTIDGKSYSQPIHLDEARHTFVVPMESDPEIVRFDPEYQVLHKLEFNPGDPKLRRQLVQAPDAIGRISAAWQLVKNASRNNVLAIIEAYKEEQFWGVRQEFGRALAKAGTEPAIEGLAKMISIEQNPQVLVRIINEAGQFRDDRIRDALSDRLSGHLTPVARREAYVAMGNQRENAAWDLLLKGSQQTGYNGHAQSGAFRGLAASRRKEVTRLLMDQVPYGLHSNRVRPAIAAGLADIGQGLEKAEREQVVERLIDLLRDPWERVRFQAAAGLCKMRAVEAIPALEAFKSTLSRQRQVHYDKLIEGLKTEDKSDGSALKKKVEDLEAKLRKLEGLVQLIQAKAEAEG